MGCGFVVEARVEADPHSEDQKLSSGNVERGCRFSGLIGEGARVRMNSIGRKIAMIGVFSVLLVVISMLALIVIQSNAYHQTVYEEVQSVIDAELDQITESILFPLFGSVSSPDQL